MNPILEAMRTHIEAGKQITRVTVENRVQPADVVFEFADETTAILAIHVDRKTFLDWWKHTGKYIRLMGYIKPLDELA